MKSIPYVVSPEEFFRYLPLIIWHLDDPMADPSAVPLWFVAREASKHVKVVLSGEGADELFGGYIAYHQQGGAGSASTCPGWSRVPLRAGRGAHPAGGQGEGPAGARVHPAAPPLRRQRRTAI